MTLRLFFKDSRVITKSHRGWFVVPTEDRLKNWIDPDPKVHIFPTDYVYKQGDPKHTSSLVYGLVSKTFYVTRCRQTTDYPREPLLKCGVK